MELLATYLPMDRRHALAQGLDLPEHTQGAVLFADISGFTPLTEALTQALGPRRGLEELLRHLEAVYDALITEVDRFGGSVVSFSGDAVTCWFDAIQPDASAPAASLRAVACALNMQRAMQQFTRPAIPGGASILLALKAAIASGPARRFVVGDPQIQLFDTLTGETINRMARAEEIVQRGQVAVDEATANAIPDLPETVRWITHTDGQRFALICHEEKCLETWQERPRQTPPCPWPELPQSIPDERLQAWLLPAVYERQRAGLGEFLTELRPAAALFLRFTGIDYEQAQAGACLDALVQRIQAILGTYEGTLLQLSIGDKGSYLYAAFGAPMAHEDDAQRSLRAALEMLALPRELAFLQHVQIGISQGMLRAGAYGGSQRRTYGVLGDDVNLAARLMQQAQPGQLLVSSRVYKSTTEHFHFSPLPPISIKGISHPLPIYAVSGEKTERLIHLMEPTYTLPLVGRTEEVSLISQKLSLARRGQGQVIGIAGEAGLGKSRLVAEVIRIARQHVLQGFGGECHSYGTNTPYLLWGPVWRGFFNLDPVMPLRRQLRAVESEVQDLAPERAAALPLLGPLLNLPIPENEFTQSLEPAERKTALQALLLDCLTAAAREAGESGSGLLFVLEDLHWIDPASFELLELLAQSITSLPVVILAAYRPVDTPHPPLAHLEALPHFTLVALKELPPADAEQIIRARLAQYAPVSPAAVPRELVENVVKRSQGNPFFVEELVNYLHDRGIDPRDPQALLAHDLPPNLQRLILARIDQLSEAQKITLKVASVIGRWFRYSWLRGYYPHLGNDQSLKADLDQLACLDLTPLETPEPELSYLFKHILTRDVAYESLASATRASLHGQLADFLELNLGETSEHFLDLLAYHYDLSDRTEKRCAYLRRAGEAAAERFANAEAVDYLSRALEATQPSQTSERFELLLVRERVYDLQGNRTAQEQDVTALEALAETSQHPSQRAQAALRRSNYAWLTSDQPATVAAAQKAVAWAQQAGLPRAEAAGHRRWGLALADPGDYAQALAHYLRALEIFRSIGENKDEAITLGNMGALAHSKGNYAEARTYLEQSLEIARQIGDRKQQAAALNSLGVLARAQGDYAAARACYEQSLTIARSIGDRRQQGSTLNNLGTISLAQGDHPAARAYYEQSLEIARAINNPRMQSNILNNLGLIALEQAEFSQAGKSFEQCLAIDRAIKNRRGESVTLGNLGDVAQATGDYPTARACYEQTLSIARTLGNKEDEGWALGALGSVALALGFFESARVYFQQSLEIVRQTGDRMWEGNTLVGLGNAILGLSKEEEASRIYHEALDLWRELGLPHLGVEAKAGLAQAALAQEEHAQALEYANEMLRYLQTGIPAGVNNPLRVFLTCYKVLQASQDGRAAEVLAQARAEIERRAAHIDEPAARRRYLENVPENREILAARPK